MIDEDFIIEDDFVFRERDFRGHSIKAFGEEKPRQDWIRDSRCQVSYRVLCQRLKKGWSPEEAIVMPCNASKKRNNQMIKAFGEIKLVTAWARDERCSVSRNTIIERIRRGMSAEEAMSQKSQSGKRLNI